VSSLKDPATVSVISSSGKRMLHLQQAAKETVSSLLFSVSNYLFVGSESGLVRVWSVQVGVLCVDGFLWG
jgi:hypothetical protein